MNGSDIAIPPVMAPLPRKLAAHLWSNATRIDAKAGRVLISHGSRSNCVYIVLAGRLQVVLFSMGGREIILRDLPEGEIFGELAAIDGLPRSATIFALGDCTLASVSASTFREGVSQDPEAALWLARRLTAQIRNLTHRVYERSALKVNSRLHCELLRRCAAVSDAGRNVPLQPSPTHAELAACIGTHREAVTREMGYLAEQGIIEQRQRRIIVSDTRALANLVHAVIGEDASLHD